MTGPAWLDAEEQALWRALLRVTVELPSSVERQLKRDAGVSSLDFRVLGSLSEAVDGTRTMSALAGRMSVSIARLSVAVGRLEKRSWVVREQNPDDGRATDVVLTTGGRAHLEAHVAQHIAELRRLVLEPIGEADRGEFSALLGRVLGTIDRDSRARFERAAGAPRGRDAAAAWSPLTGPRSVSGTPRDGALHG